MNLSEALAENALLSQQLAAVRDQRAKLLSVEAATTALLLAMFAQLQKSEVALARLFQALTKIDTAFNDGPQDMQALLTHQRDSALYLTGFAMWTKEHFAANDGFEKQLEASGLVTRNAPSEKPEQKPHSGTCDNCGAEGQVVGVRTADSGPAVMEICVEPCTPRPGVRS